MLSLKLLLFLLVSSSVVETFNSVNTSESFHIRTNTRISTVDIIEQISTNSEVACLLSCKQTPNCLCSAIQDGDGSSFKCFHLNGTTRIDGPSPTSVLLHRTVDKREGKLQCIVSGNEANNCFYSTLFREPQFLISQSW